MAIPTTAYFAEWVANLGKPTQILLEKAVLALLTLA